MHDGETNGIGQAEVLVGVATKNFFARNFQPGIRVDFQQAAALTDGIQKEHSRSVPAGRGG